MPLYSPCLPVLLLLLPLRRDTLLLEVALCLRPYLVYLLAKPLLISLLYRVLVLVHEVVDLVRRL